MSKKTKIIAVIALAVLIIGAIVAYAVLSPKAISGGKSITVEVVHADGSSKEFKIATDEEYLGGALRQENLVEGEDGEFGLYIHAADGEYADESQQQWWCCCKAGEMLMTGVDDTPIADGEHYELVLKTGW